ncbi:mismatch-specific DNA-glycosylase, partial [Thioclava sp. BHET1]
MTAPAGPVLPDHLAPGLRLIFCGSAAGHVSARRGAYYAGPGNLFWPMLAETGLTPRRFAPEEAALLLPLGIGLTDLAKEARGMDHEIPRAAYTPDRLRALIASHAPRHLAFNGKRAAQIALDRALGYG